MDYRIIYPKDDGGVAIVVPGPDGEFSPEQLASEVVPPGKPYKIIDVADVPSDRTFRDAWEYSE